MTKFDGKRLMRQDREDYGEAKKVTTKILINDAENAEYHLNLSWRLAGLHRRRADGLKADKDSWKIKNGIIHRMSTGEEVDQHYIPKQTRIEFKDDDVMTMKAVTQAIATPMEDMHVSHLHLPVFTTGQASEKKRLLTAEKTVQEYSVTTLEELIGDEKHSLIVDYASYIGVSAPDRFQSTDDLVEWITGQVPSTKGKSSREQFALYLATGRMHKTSDYILIGQQNNYYFYGFGQGFPLYGVENKYRNVTVEANAQLSDESIVEVANCECSWDDGAYSIYSKYDKDCPHIFFKQAGVYTGDMKVLTVTSRGLFCGEFTGDLDLRSTVEVLPAVDEAKLSYRAIPSSLELYLDIDEELLLDVDYTLGDDGRTIKFQRPVIDDAQLTCVYLRDYGLTVDALRLDNFIIEYTVSRRDKSDIGFILEGCAEYQ